MRTVPTLALTPTDKAITTTCDDRDPASGNMSHEYSVSWDQGGGYIASAGIKFQHGPIAEAGVNGLTNEVLLSIVRDRLEGAQEGPSVAARTRWRSPRSRRPSCGSPSARWTG